MTYWENLNNYIVPASNYDLIPSGTLAKVRMTIKSGGYNDPEQGWTDGYVTKSNETGSIFLEAEFIVLEGQYAKRKVWGKIGLYSKNGPGWGNMGMAFIKSAINSAKGFSAKDDSEIAVLARSIKGFASLDGLEFVAKSSTSFDKHGEIRNEINTAITPDHKDYAALMGRAAIQTTNKNDANTNTNTNTNRPNWA